MYQSTPFLVVFPYLHDIDDRNVVSLVCRKWYELDCMSRKHLTVHLIYFPEPSRLHQRFPFIESLTLQGFPDSVSRRSLNIDIDITQWIEEISVSYKCLKALHVCRVHVFDSDLELLARSRGKDLRHLEIFKCRRFSTDGLMHIGKYCTDLKSLSLEGSELEKTDGQWVHELALHNSNIESLCFVYEGSRNIDVNDLILLAKNCSQSLVSLQLGEIELGDFYRYAVRLEDVFVSEYVNVGIKLPPNLRCMRMFELTKSTYQLVLPFAHQLRELQIYFEITLDLNAQCFLIQRCSNLEVFYLPCIHDDVDVVLQVIGQFCKKLRKLSTPLHSCKGLIAVAQGCIHLECLYIAESDIEIVSEIFECIGTYLKNLRDFSIWTSDDTYPRTMPLYTGVDNGVRLMLIGCIKLERLHISLCHGALTDVGLEYIGKYGHNLKSISLRFLEEYDLGLAELTKGCPKLRELEITASPYRWVTNKWCTRYDIHSLSYVWTREQGFSRFVLTRHDYVK